MTYNVIWTISRSRAIVHDVYRKLENGAETLRVDVDASCKQKFLKQFTDCIWVKEDPHYVIQKNKVGKRRGLLIY